MKWENGILQNSKVHSEIGGRGKVVYKEIEKVIKLAAGKNIELKL